MKQNKPKKTVKSKTVKTKTVKTKTAKTNKFTKTCRDIPLAKIHQQLKTNYPTTLLKVLKYIKQNYNGDICLATEKYSGDIYLSIDNHDYHNHIHIFYKEISLKKNTFTIRVKQLQRNYILHLPQNNKEIVAMANILYFLLWR